jgi:putative SOS response-associated peptidase YedK
MCGRYSLSTDIEGLSFRFDFKASGLTFQERYNIAPTQRVLTVTNDGSENQAQMMKWGLIPFWAKDPKIGNRSINARAETVHEKPMFRQAFQKRRCLIVADGFFEWMKEGKDKVPMRITLKSGEPFGFAGLWETWKSPEEELIRSCSIVTTTPNELMAPIHDRMPVILSRKSEGLWLNPAQQDTDTLKSLLAPYIAADMEAYTVSSLVNSPRNDTPDLIARVI